MNERQHVERLRRAAWEHPLTRRQDTQTLATRHTAWLSQTVAVALSLNR